MIEIVKVYSDPESCTVISYDPKADSIVVSMTSGTKLYVPFDDFFDSWVKFIGSLEARSYVHP